MWKTILGAAAILGLTISAASAASVQVRTIINCGAANGGNIQNGFGQLSAGSCSHVFPDGVEASADASAIAEQGKIRLGANASVGDTRFNSSNPTASALSTLTDELSISGIQSGQLLVRFHVEGSYGLSTPVTSSFGGLGFATDLVGQSNSDSNAVFYTNRLEQSGTGEQINTVVQVDDILELQIAFDNTETPDLVELSIHMQLQAHCNRMPSCNSFGNFLHSGTILSSLVLDDQGNVFTGATISSASGIDYNTGFISAVPVPAALPLLIAALGVFGCLRFQRTSLR